MSTFAKLWIMGYIANKPKFSDKSHELMASFQLTDWYDIICVNQLADFAERALKKGMLVYVQARPVFEGSTHIDGLKDNALRFFAEEINIISSASLEKDLSND